AELRWWSGPSSPIASGELLSSAAVPMPAPSRTERREGPRGPRADEPPREGQSPPADEPAAAGKGARARRGRGIIAHAPAEARGGEGRGGSGSVRQPAWRAAGAARYSPLHRAGHGRLGDALPEEGVDGHDRPGRDP